MNDEKFKIISISDKSAFGEYVNELLEKGYEIKDVKYNTYIEPFSNIVIKEYIAWFIKI